MKSASQGYFVCDSSGRWYLEVLELMFTVLEVLEPDEPPVHQSIEAVIQRAKTDANMCG